MPVGSEQHIASFVPVHLSSVSSSSLFASSLVSVSLSSVSLSSPQVQSLHIGLYFAAFPVGSEQQVAASTPAHLSLPFAQTTAASTSRLARRKDLIISRESVVLGIKSNRVPM